MSAGEIKGNRSTIVRALKRLQYVVTNNGFSTKPDVTWDDVWGLDHIRQQLYEHVIRPFKSPEECKGSESSLKTSFLLYGPPGVGKKSVALAVANEACEAGLSFIHVKGFCFANERWQPFECCSSCFVESRAAGEICWHLHSYFVT
ncbi:unnamed protein product [Arabidopsis halleri]